MNPKSTKVTSAGVTALQKALPNCKIEWDGASKLAYLDPAFQQWVKEVQAMSAEQQIEAVSKKLMELNPGFDGKVASWDGKGTPKIISGVVRWLGFVTDNVTDISPVRALAGLQKLMCYGSVGRHGKLSDLSPLQGMSLISLNCGNTQVSDLSPLQGTNLQDLTCNSTLVSDLTPLKGMPLTALLCPDTLVSDLSPLEGMSLADVMFTPKNITHGLEVIRQMKSLKTIDIEWGDNNKFHPAEFWKRYDAGEFSKPTARAKLAYLDPAFQKWVADSQKLPAEQQIEAVRKKLMELNPGFDGKITASSGKGSPNIESGVVIGIGFFTDSVSDISPVRAIAGLHGLSCFSSGEGKSKLSDLLPIEGMPLAHFWCANTQVSDLSALEGMNSLESLRCNGTQVSDLSPLANCKSLKTLDVRKTKVTPAQIAALQKALRNCEIEWED